MAPAPLPIRVNRAPVLTLWATVVERPVECLQRAGYVVMCKPAADPHFGNLTLTGWPEGERKKKPDRSEQVGVVVPGVLTLVLAG